MPMEGGEPKKDILKNREFARQALLTLHAALYEAGRERLVDLNRISHNPKASEIAGFINQKTALEMAVKVLRAYLKYLDPHSRNEADLLIITAELYLAAHEPKQK